MPSTLPHHYRICARLHPVDAKGTPLTYHRFLESSQWLDKTDKHPTAKVGVSKYECVVCTIDFSSLYIGMQGSLNCVVIETLVDGRQNACQLHDPLSLEDRDLVVINPKCTLRQVTGEICLKIVVDYSAQDGRNHSTEYCLKFMYEKGFGKPPIPLGRNDRAYTYRPSIPEDNSQMEEPNEVGHRVHNKLEPPSLMDRMSPLRKPEQQRRDVGNHIRATKQDPKQKFDDCEDPPSNLMLAQRSVTPLQTMYPNENRAIPAGDEHKSKLDRQSDTIKPTTEARSVLKVHKNASKEAKTRFSPGENNLNTSTKSIEMHTSPKQDVQSTQDVLDNNTTPSRNLSVSSLSSFLSHSRSQFTTELTKDEFKEGEENMYRKRAEEARRIREQIEAEIRGQELMIEAEEEEAKLEQARQKLASLKRKRK